MSSFAMVVGINEYPQQTGQKALKGAVADACDFAEWALDANGGAVAAQNLYFWAHPWPANAGPLLQPILAAPTQFKSDFGLIDPHTQGRAPKAREIVTSLLTRGEHLALGQGGAPPHRVYVFLAGHGVCTTEGTAEDAQTCFVAADFENINNQMAHGLVACESLKRALLEGGFDEVFMFLDCCRVKDPVLPIPAAVLCGGTDTRSGVPWLIGNGAELGKQAFEVTGPPARGAFSVALLDGLRTRRDAYDQSLSAGLLRNFIAKKIQTRARGQKPDFKFSSAEPGPNIFPPVAGVPPVAGIILDLSGLPDGVTVCVSDTDLIAIPGFEAIPAGPNLVSIPGQNPSFYQVERSDQPDVDPQAFRHPRKDPFRVQ